MKRPSATVVIPAWNAWEHTERCLRSLLATLGPDDQVVVVDNGSEDATAEGLRRRPWCEVVTNAENLGFARACNQGAARGIGDVVVFLNSDTMVGPGWLEGLLEPFADTSVGAVGPRSNFVSGPQLAPAGDYDPADVESYVAFAEGWRARHAGERMEISRLVGFCLAVRRVAFDAVGGFDEGFRRGGYEDDDLCARLRHAGWRLVVAGDVYVHHEGHASFDANGVDWRAAELESAERFVAKHAPSPEHPLISLCMIVRDEEAFLPACLASVEGLVDEVVIADTGSRDATVEIAESHGATVLQVPWRDDFAWARNQALERCRGDWVLWLDADETLQADPAPLRAFLRQAPESTDGYVLRIENRMGSGLGSPTVHAAVRLFRRERCWWVGRLHEQVLRRSEPESTQLVALEGAVISHSGYLDRVLVGRHKRARNLALAESAAEEEAPGLELAYGRFNLGRAKLVAGDAEGGIGLLEEAARSATNAVTRRSALWMLAEALIAAGRPLEALGPLEELRALSSTPALADFLEARARLAVSEPEAALALLEPLRAGQPLDDGFELASGVLAALRADALSALGRPDEAAANVLDALAEAGVMDVDLGRLVGWMTAAGRPLSELVERIGPECLWSLSAQAAMLGAEQADQLAEALWARFPGRVEVLVAISTLTASLGLERVLVWSARRRQLGLSDDCPLLDRAKDAARSPSERLQAASVAHGAFLDQRALPLAEAALAELDDRPGALRSVAKVAPGLVAALEGQGWRGPLAKVNLGGGDDRLPGYLTVDLRRACADVVADARRLPFADGSVSHVIAHDVLEHLSEWEMPQVLAELWRVLGPRGRLEARVPNLAALGAMLAIGEQVDGVVRNLYGGHRFGPGGAFDAHHWGWTPASFAAELERAGFAVLANDEALKMTVVAERQPTLVRPAPPSTERFSATVVIPVFGRAELTRRCLERLALVDAGASFEVVVVDNGSTDETPALLAGLGGDVAVVTNWTNRGFARACNQGARLARSDRLVFVNNDVEVAPGWLGALLGTLDEPGVGIAGAVLHLPDGTVQHAGVTLVDDGHLLSGVHVGAGQRMADDVSWPARPAVVTGALMAVRRDAFWAAGGFDEGYWNGNEDVDLCLKLREAGWEVALASRCRAIHHESRSGPARWERVAENVARLTFRWRGRLPDGVLASSPAAVVPPSPKRRIGPPKRGGLNVVGFLHGALGLGEAARGWVRAAEAVGIPVSTVAARGHWNADDVEFPSRGEPFGFDTTVVVANPDAYLGVVAEVGVEGFADRYVIGQWVWDLEQPSEEMRRAASLIHELWTPSEFSAISMRAVAGSKPVSVIPYPVPVRWSLPQMSRAQLGMPEGFLFAYVMDFNSTAERNNPLGLVQAFCRAFAPGEGPRLYLKTMNGAKFRPAIYRQVTEATRGRPDIVVVDEEGPKAHAEAILALSDCYVSLHRSEGFGLTIAEAMAAGTPVISTAYSGSLEVTGTTDGDCARLVPWQPSRVQSDTTLYPAGATWAEPDVEAAARAMRWVYEHPEEARAMGARGRARIAERFSYERVGSQVAARLAEIAEARYATLPPARRRAPAPCRAQEARAR